MYVAGLMFITIWYTVTISYESIQKFEISFILNDKKCYENRTF